MTDDPMDAYGNFDGLEFSVHPEAFGEGSVSVVTESGVSHSFDSVRVVTDFQNGDWVIGSYAIEDDEGAQAFMPEEAFPRESVSKISMDNADGDVEYLGVGGDDDG